MSENIISRLRANDPRLTYISFDARSRISFNQFCSSVQENSSISSLYISDFDIGMVAATELSAALGRMSYLEKISMMRCPWDSAEVATTLASSLANRDTLRTLQLFDCNIDGGCVQAISTSFSAHQSLRKLTLVDNPIGNMGAISIGSLLPLNSSLTTVNVCRSNIGAEGFEAIAGGIAKNRTLEYLDLGGNAAPFESIQDAFKRALYNNDSIEAVLTGSNHTLNHFTCICFTALGDANLPSLLAMNRGGPEEARRRKLIRFLDENPGSVGVNDRLLPSAIEKIGRVGGLDAMYLFVRDIPGMFEKKDSS